MKRALLILLVIILVAAGATFYFYRGVVTPYRAFQGETFVTIEQGSSVAAMGRRLAEAGVVRDARSFQIAARVKGAEKRLQAGEYRFEKEATPFEIVERLARGDVFVRPITFPEGRTLAEMAAIFEERQFGTAADFLEPARDQARIASLDPAATDLEGYLFPSTYRLPRNTSARALVGLMVQSFEKAFDADLRAAASALGMSVREAVTMASLVEEEAQKPEERPMISAVYHNRLKIGMGLQ